MSIELRPNTLEQLAKMICGDSPYTEFPYRSSWYLTQFFTSLGLGLTHNGQTRFIWVKERLAELNLQPGTHDSLPTESLCRTIESLLDADYFENPSTASDRLDRVAAIAKVKGILQRYELSLAEDTRHGTVRLVAAPEGTFISTALEQTETTRVITFSPTVFDVPRGAPDPTLVGVMMPFSAEFRPVYEAIRGASTTCELRCLRADDIWNSSAFMQDIFDIIFSARIVIVDFSGKNPNVMYETGIAHTLGKEVIPLTQNIQDVPSDLRHHRALIYLPNEQGYRDLETALVTRIRIIVGMAEQH